MASALSAERKLEALFQALGDTILAALKDPDVVEILANPDGRLVLDVAGHGRRDCGVALSAEARERAIRLVADHVGESADRDRPRLAGVLPDGERFQAVLPPVAPAPAFAIRKPARTVWTLTDYVRQGVLDEHQAGVLRAAVQMRRNLLICGGAGSGKTTLANAILAEPAFAADRLILIEDTPELRSTASDALSLLTRRTPPVGMADLIRDALRLRPDRIVIGEIRDGAAALETLKAWNTGHPGGLSTLHANSAVEALDRLEDLLLETMPTVPARLIDRAIDLVVFVERTDRGRKVSEIWDVDLDQGAAKSPSHQKR